MKVYVNDKPVDLLPGMKVMHALTGAEFLAAPLESMQVFDEWGNEIGLDGALSEGMRIYVR
jgi:hypothetical protein